MARTVGIRGDRFATLCRVDIAAPMGIAVTVLRGRRAARAARVAIACGVLLMGAVRASADEQRYAVVITGASGGDTYAQKYQKIRNAFIATLRDTFDYKVEQMFVFAEEQGDGVQKATRENVQRTLGELRKRLAKDDQLLILLVGHGT